MNDELGALKRNAAAGSGCSEEGGRIAVITFHSLEDRIVKNFFKNGNFDEEPENDIYGTLT